MLLNGNTELTDRLLTLVEQQNLNIEDLQNKVQCGAEGHKFQLQNLFEDTDSKNKPYFSGEFKCYTCDTVIFRNLTAEEVVAAKKLNF